MAQGLARHRCRKPRAAPDFYIGSNTFIEAIYKRREGDVRASPRGPRGA